MPKQLRDLADVNYGQSPSGVLDQDGCIPVVGTGGTYATANRSLFSPPAIVVPRKGSLGNPQLMEQQFWAVDTTYAVIPKPGIDAAWLYYNLDRYDLTRLNEATGVPSISRDWLYRISFHDPGPDAQKKIGVVLRSIDDAIERTRSLIAKYQQVKAGVMHDLFTRGLDANGHLRPSREEAPELYKDSPLGWIPNCWSIAPIRDVCTLIVDCPHSTPVLSDNGYPMVRTSEIKNGTYLVDQSPRVSESEYRKRNGRAVPQPNDIVFTREAPVGHNFVVPDGLNVCLGQRLMLMRPNSSICRPGFLSHQLYAERAQQSFGRITGGTTNPHINVTDVKQFLVALPPVEEQISIELLLTSIDTHINAETRMWQKLMHMKQGLMNDILSGCVRVKVHDLVGEHAHV
jgi:type I restriction enzyme, S subunit